MRVRIIRKPAPEYADSIERDSLLVGRVYNLAAPLASALLLDGFAEAYDTLTPDEKRERSEEAAHEAWTANDRRPRWPVPKAGRRR